ncbi:MAG: hypothetical protein KKH12_03040 [Gammaproteobacteria bacterium]|nr:hypothetical protein [Gammaproteobacteria bacterium]MBU1480630.1 hypothetical protein [Gammaproteobacteria bacterium]
MYKFIGRHAPVVIALVFSSFVLIAGAWLAWQCNPAWLNRAGALIIIAGVLLGASRFYEWVQQKIADFVQANYDSIANDALTVIEAERTKPFDEADHLRIRTSIKEELHKDFGEIFAEDKTRLKKWEIYLIVIGTFLNGFGDYLVSILKAHGT